MPGDPHWAPPLPPGETFLAACADRARAGCGSAGSPRRSSPTPTSIPTCSPRTSEASRLLEPLGHDVEDVEPPFAADAVPPFETVWRPCSRRIPRRPRARGASCMPLTRYLRERGSAVSGADYVTAVSAMQARRRRRLSRLAAYDVLLCPTLAQPRAAGRRDPRRRRPGRGLRGAEAVHALHRAFNVTGQPALSLPLRYLGGRTADRRDARRSRGRRGAAARAGCPARGAPRRGGSAVPRAGERLARRPRMEDSEAMTAPPSPG